MSRDEKRSDEAMYEVPLSRLRELTDDIKRATGERDEARAALAAAREDNERLTNARAVATDAVHEATNLLYEVAAWLHDVAVGDVEFDTMHDALIDRLIPVADASLAAARGADNR